MAASNLNPLTSLRFFAALWVVVYAYWPNLAVLGTPRLVERGFLGVEVFFVLSGFILCHVYLPAWEAARFGYGRFLWARIARVYPLHLATLAGVGLLAGAAVTLGMSIDNRILAWDALPANILMVHAWGVAKTVGWNHPSWSISAEWFAYLSFPLFAWAASGLRARPVIATAGAVAALFIAYAAFERLAGFSLTRATNMWGALRIVPCFTLGCAVYLLWNCGLVRKRWMALSGALAALVALFGCVVSGAPDAAVVSAGSALIFFLAACSSTGSAVGSQRSLVYLGEISYALYMVAIPWQLAFVNAATRVLHLQDKQLPLAVWLVYLAGAVILAAAAHHVIERPAREGVRLWGAELFRPRQVAAVG